jgi:hypothetical protein
MLVPERRSVISEPALHTNSLEEHSLTDSRSGAVKGSAGKYHCKALANGVHSPTTETTHGTTGIDLLRASARDCRPFNLTTRIEWRRQLSRSRWACVALPPIKCSAEGAAISKQLPGVIRDRVQPATGPACPGFASDRSRARELLMITRRHPIALHLLRRLHYLAARRRHTC